MKTRLVFALTCCLLWFSFQPTLHAQGISFETGTLAEVKAKAKAENKAIFIDVYTDWCVPCKVMASQTFTRDDVGEVYNDKLINYKIDAEKGEGIAFAKEYGVNAYPTLLFINHEGKLLRKLIGTQNQDRLIEEANTMEVVAQYGGFDQMKADFATKKNDTDYLKDLYSVLPSSDSLKSETAVSYLLIVPEDSFFSEEKEDMDLHSDMIGQLKTYDDAIFAHLLSLLEKKKSSSGGKFPLNYKNNVAASIQQTVGQLMKSYIASADEQKLEACLAFRDEFNSKLGQLYQQDSDISISNDRIFDASSDFIRLRYMSQNDTNHELYRKQLAQYMKKMMQAHSKESLVENTLPADYHRKEFKENSSMVGRFLLNNNITNTLTVEYLTDFVRHYWRISPNDKKTKNDVAEWIAYAGSINIYNTKYIKENTYLLVKVGHAKEAIKDLQTVIDAHSIHQGFDQNLVKDLKQMIVDIKNDKI